MNKTIRISRITTLWILIMTGLIYHTVLHLAPIFYGIDIVKKNATGQMPLSMVLTFGLAYFIPVVAIVSIRFLQNSWGRVINLLCALFVLLINTAHVSELFIAQKTDPTQLFVLIPEFLLAVLLSVDSWKLWKPGEKKRRSVKKMIAGDRMCRWQSRRNESMVG